MHHHGWLYTLLLVLLLSTSRFNWLLTSTLFFHSLWYFDAWLLYLSASARTSRPAFSTKIARIFSYFSCLFLFFLELRIFLFSSFVCLILVLEPVKTADGQNQRGKTANIRALFYPFLFGELSQIKNTSTQSFCGCRWQPVHVVFKFKPLHNRCI